MRQISIGLIAPLFFLTILLTLGTRQGTAWRNNLENSPKSWGLKERFSSIVPNDLEWLEGYSGDWGRYGLTLGPGEKGYARFKFKGIQGADVLIRLWAYDYGGCTIRWWPADQDPAEARTLSSGGSVLGGRFKIGSTLGTNGFILEVSGENKTTAPQLLLDQIFVSSSAFRPIDGWSKTWWLWGLCTLLWWWFAAKRKWWNPPGGMILWGCGLTVVLLGGHLRLNLLPFLNGVPLESDVIMYLRYADRLSWFGLENGFYSAAFGEREPLWIAIFRIWQAWVGYGDFAVRFLTSLLSTAVVVQTGVFLWRWLHERIWVIAGMLMVSLNPALIEESYRGLRSEIMTLGFITFLILSFPVGNRHFQAAKAGFMVGLWALLRSTALGLAFGLWGALWLIKTVFSRRNTQPWLPQGYSLKKISLAAVIAICLFMPHLYGLHKRYGDWRWPSYGYARWNANMEFPERFGTTGFPTLEEFKESPYSGPRISYADYLFDLHTPLQLVRYQLLGWVELFGYQALSFSAYRTPLVIQLTERRIKGIRHLVAPSIVFAFVMGLISLGAWFRLFLDRNLWWIPPTLLWGTSYVAMLYHVRVVEPIRHTVHVYLLMVLLTVWGIRWIFKSAPALRIRTKIAFHFRIPSSGHF